MDDQQRARELMPCPFCGSADSEMQQAQAEHYVQCLECEASTSLLSSRREARELWNRRAALRAAPEWQPIETAPEGRLVVVGWLDTEDSHYPENYEFDYLEGGLWSKHEDYVEHAHAVAPPGSQMPKEQPPYQWWMDLPAFPAARPQGVK